MRLTQGFARRSRECIIMFVFSRTQFIFFLFSYAETWGALIQNLGRKKNAITKSGL